MNKLNKLIRASILGISILMLSACGVDMVQITTPDIVMQEVASRNITALESLLHKGAISLSTFNYYSDAIRARADTYATLILKSVEEQDRDSYDKLKDQLISATVARLGADNGKGGLYGVGTKTPCLYYNFEENPCDFVGEEYPLKTDSFYGFNPADLEKLYTKDNKSKMTTEIEKKADGINVSPLSILDEGNMNGLIAELNKQVYILDTNQFKTEGDWYSLLEKLNYIKQVQDSPTANKEDDATYIKYRQVVRDYFKDSGFKLYDYTLDDVLTESKDNSSNLGKSPSDFDSNNPANFINKDVLLFAPISAEKHKERQDPKEDCGDDKVIESKEVGVYTIRVHEFDKAFIDSLTNDVTTNNKFIPLEYSDRESSIVLLMEYPVAILDSVEGVSPDSPTWRMNFVDSEMRVNIYNGEMLTRGENGYKVINQGSSSEDRIYRVIPENIGLDTGIGKNSSFVPYGYANLTLSDVTNQEVVYNQVTLKSEKDSGTSLNEFGIELHKSYPDAILRKDDVTCVKELVSGNTYNFRFKKSDGTLIRSRGYYRVKTSDSYLRKLEDIVTFENLWTYVRGLISELESNSDYYKLDRDFELEDYSLYKMYKKLLDSNQISSSSRVSDYFSDALIYWSLVDYFKVDGSNRNYLSSIFLKKNSDYDRSFYNWMNQWEEFGCREEVYNTEMTYSPYIDNWDEEKLNNVIKLYQGLDLMSYIDNINKLEPNGVNIISKDFVGNSFISIIYDETGLVNLNKNIGSVIELTDDNRDDLYFDEEIQAWIFEYNREEYICEPEEKLAYSNETFDMSNLNTTRFALKDYLELTYMPGVVLGDALNGGVDENFIATGRRISITKFEGEGDEVCGYYTDKYGDKIVLNDQISNTVDVKVSELIDYSSGGDDYYESIAKSLAFDGNKNLAEVEKELRSKSLNSLKELFRMDGESTMDDTGMVSDDVLLPYNVYYNSISPVLTFTSNEDETSDRPALDSMDVDNDEIPDACYYGLCVNTHPYQTGLYTQWIDVVGEGGNLGSLDWWNGWLSNHNYNYSIDINKLKSRMNGIYSVSLAELDETIVLDTNTINVINKEMIEEKEVKTTNTLRTVSLILGSFFLLYGTLMLASWLIDINMVNGPGLLTIITLGNFVAMRDTSEIPRISDGKTYVDFKYLMVVLVILIVLGITLIVFDLGSIISLITNMFSGTVDLFKDLMLNK